VRIIRDLFTSAIAYVRMHQSQLCKHSLSLSLSPSLSPSLKLKVNTFICQHQLPQPCCYFKLEVIVPEWQCFVTPET